MGSIANSPAEILYATDFCEAAGHALKFAKKVARLRGCAVRAIHVIDLSGPAGGVYASYAAAYDVAVRRLRALRRELRLSGIPRSATLITSGAPARAIRDAAFRYQSGMIVLGLFGESDVLTTSLGRVARSILRRAQCPVLTVGPGSPETDSPDFKRVFYITDISPDSLLAATHVWPAQFDHLATRPRAVLPAPKDAEKLPPANASLSAPFLPIEHHNAGATLLAEAASSNADLIVLGVRSGGYLDVFHAGSVPNALISRATCPVLTVRC